jgi:hypothetical protein
MTTRVRSKNDTRSADWSGQSRSASNPRASRAENHLALVRIGGIAGMLSPLPLLAAGLITATAGQNLRQNDFPWAATLAAILTATCVLGLRALLAAHGSAVVRVAGLATAIALVGIAGFFAALGTEDLLATVAGTSRFLSNNEAITGIGTLTGSLLTLVVTPTGLLILGVAAFRSRLLSRTGRIAAVALTPCLVLGALTSAAATSAPAAAAWVPAFSACWFLLGRALLRSCR